MDTLAGVRTLLAAVTGQLLRGTMDVRKASAALAGLRELARLLERAEGTGHSLPAGARPATPEEEAHLVEHGEPPAGIVLGIYAVPVADAAPPAKDAEDGSAAATEDTGASTAAAEAQEDTEP